MTKIERLKKLADNIMRLSNDLQSGKFTNELGRICGAVIAKDLDKIFKTSIDIYYSYKTGSHGKGVRRYYKRTYSFYKTYKIGANGAEIFAKAGEELMPHTHRAPNEYIYEYMFQKGFHGGAARDLIKKTIDASGMPLPEGIEMAQRTPVPEFATENLKMFSLWSKVSAAQSDPAPEEDIQNNLDAYTKGESNYSGSTLEERFSKSVNKLFKSYNIG